MANVYRLSLALILCIVDLPSVQAQGNYAYVGCYWDDSIRALPDLVSCGSPCSTVCSSTMPYCQTASMTVDVCVELCKSKTFKYAGLQAGGQCFCGVAEAMFDQHGVGLSCTMPCVGNSSQVCGDVYRNSVYDTLYQPPSCPQPAVIAKGMIQTGEKTEYFEGDVITYTCEGMTVMLGDPTMICLPSGEWDSPPPECRTVCSEQLAGMESNRGAPIALVEYIMNVNVEGELYLLPCLTGYTSSSESLLAICQGDGNWNYNSTDTVCQAVVCPTPVLGEGVFMIGNDFTYLSTVTYSCINGYTSSSGSVVHECQADGTWYGMDISCSVVVCPPPVIADGMLVTPGPYSFGDQVTYFCRGEGTILIGSSTRMCTADGSWSGQPPVCQIVTMPTPTTNPSRTTMPIITLATNVITQRPITNRATTQRPTIAGATTQRLMTTPVVTQRPTTMVQPVATTNSGTTWKLITTQRSIEQPRETSTGPTVTYRPVTDLPATTLSTIVNSSSGVVVTSSNESSPLPSVQSTTSDGFNEKAKSDKSPADFMVLIVIGAGVFSVLLLSIIFTVACVKSPKRGKAHVTKSINFISSKETGSMMDILWPEDLLHDSPRSRADSGLPSSDRNSPAGNDESPDCGDGGVVNLAFENDDLHRRSDDDPYHVIEFAAVNETNSVSNVLINSGIMSPAPQTQDDRSSISHSRVNSFQQPDDVESLYAKVDMSKKSNKGTLNGIDRTQSTLSDYTEEENPLYEQSPMPKLVLPTGDNLSISNGVVRKTSRRTPSDVSVSSPSYWAQYEEQVTRL